MANPNFLILDEPSNDLDLVTLSVLEDFLQKFSGCVLIVSHDRFFLDQLADHLFIFEGDGVVTDFNGNYSDYRDYLADKEEEARKPKPVEKAIVKQDGGAKKLSFKEKKEFEDLEKEIKELEMKKEKALEKLNASSNNHDELLKWSTEIEKLTEAIDEKTLRWLELADKG